MTLFYWFYLFDTVKMSGSIGPGQSFILKLKKVKNFAQVTFMLDSSLPFLDCAKLYKFSIVSLLLFKKETLFPHISTD